MCTPWLTWLIERDCDFWYDEVMEAFTFTTQPRSGWAQYSETEENLCLHKGHFPRWGGHWRTEIIVVASELFQEAVPELQDDSALYSLCRRKSICQIVVWCVTVMSVNAGKEATQIYSSPASLSSYSLDWRRVKLF